MHICKGIINQLHSKAMRAIGSAHTNTPRLIFTNAIRQTWGSSADHRPPTATTRAMGMVVEDLHDNIVRQKLFINRIVLNVIYVVVAIEWTEFCRSMILDMHVFFARENT